VAGEALAAVRSRHHRRGSAGRPAQHVLRPKLWTPTARTAAGAEPARPRSSPRRG